VRKTSAFLLASLLAIPALAVPSHAALILSELCDPQSNFQTDRFIEVFNTGPNAVDLTGWSVVAIANNVDVTTWPLSGSLPAGEARVVGHTTTVTGFTVHFQNSQWGTSGYFNWNGRVGDGAKLVAPGSVIVDHIVAPGTLFENADLVRNANVSAPSVSYNAAEWTATPVALATNASPGTHNGSSPTAGGPVVSGIVTDPATPLATVATDVQASIVDTSGAIGAVTLSWGLAANSLSNAIGMSVLSGSTYRTVSPIPGQPGGATVHYRIQAQGASATTTTSTLSYTLAGGGGTPPTVLSVGEMSDSTLLVIFSEPVEETSAEAPGNYSVGALVAVAAERDPVTTAHVLITVRGLTAGTRTLTVSGVSDLDGGTAFGATRDFPYVDVTIPAGYYDGIIGLTGDALRLALHNRIKNHTVRSYDFALTAFQTSDVKWNGKVWDMYSDIPGGTPPYEYAFGATGQGATEGLGYNREHTWPQSWFGESSPMVSDLWNLCPTDSRVNGYRGNFPFGDVGTATTTSLNGSKVGPSVTPGYTGTVFEPIDPFKGDLARMHFYMSTRYYTQDAGWPGSPSTDGADLLPWAIALCRSWSDGDPVSWKERMRNGAIYAYQNNRNPFVDHPEFLAQIYDTTATTGVDRPVTALTVQLLPNRPNPFGSRTTIGFTLAQREAVALRVHDIHGRHVRTLASGTMMDAGTHQLEWDGRDDSGQLLEAGLYFCRLDAASASATRRMVFAH